MPFSRVSTQSFRGFLAAFTGLLLVSGTLLWLVAQSVPSGLFAASESTTQLVLAVALFLSTLGGSILLVRYYFIHPIRRLVSYVEQQHEDDRKAPPSSLLEPDDDIALLTSEIQRQMEILRNQNDKLLEQSLNDPLTGLGNRRLLEHRLDVALPLNRRRMESLSALMIDIDHFKNYNDHYGHPAGDRCLIIVANVLRDIFRRETDIIVRLGGEEFLVVLLATDLNEAMKLAETMRKALQAAGIPHSDSSTAPVVTASIGVATAKPGTPVGVDSLIANADAALYRCKAEGRNCSSGHVIDTETSDQPI